MSDPHVDPFYIRTRSPLTDESSLVLKDGDAFVVLDAHGDIRPVEFGDEGLYDGGTRFLSGLTVRFAGHRPLLLGAAVRSDNAGIAVDLTNPDLVENGALIVPHGTLHLSRLLVLSGGVLHDRLRLKNFGLDNVRVTLEIAYAADFVDLFEVRGTQRRARGERHEPAVDGNEVVFAYRGLDHVVRRTRIGIEPDATRLGVSHAELDCELPPKGERLFSVSYTCENPERRVRTTFPVALQAATERLEQREAQYCRVVTSNHQFNEWLRRSLADLSMMMADTRFGEYPHAGVPWFSCPFGRDGLITAFSTLWANPNVSRGVLSFLAATQATSVDPASDATPGKILHEMRSGEMAATGEVPFARYYGSHDATPLFVMLAAAYLDRTNDRAFIEQIWPSIDAALRWIERDGDLDGDGFAEYARQTSSGLANQGWKDSHDAVFHGDGEAARGPIAICEIQAYVYAAWQGASRMAAATGRPALVTAYARKAAALADRFDTAFWSDVLGTYVLALDGDKRPCAVRASNAGHALFAGIAPRHRAGAIARTLMSPEGYSGWGVRTLGAAEARYNPMSYHNGSVWPHDNAMIALGLSRYGLQDEAQTILTGLYEATLYMDLHRLPELFCGFARERGEGPILYPVACNPQAWSSASVLLLLQAVLGLQVRAADRTVTFTRPTLPDFLQEISIRGLPVGPHSIDLLLERHDYDVGINVLRRSGPVEVVAIK
jgi:glycogen debranching enzyme